MPENSGMLSHYSMLVEHCVKLIELRLQNSLYIGVVPNTPHRLLE
jgi:hypothetical protein